MQFPQRTDNHIAETKSWRLLAGLAPDEWILREVSERDYGVDAYIEIATASGEITGELISVQLKSTELAEWKGPNPGKRKATSPSIATSTARYWLNLPVPVFLFVADTKAKDIFFVSVEPQIRGQMDKLDQQRTISFDLRENHSLRSETAAERIRTLAVTERFHPQFTVHVTSLLSSIDSFGHYILSNQGRDLFMEVEIESHMQFRNIYECCRRAALVLNISWTLESLADAYRRDRARWKDEYCYLHEETLDGLLQNLQKIFPVLVRHAVQLITKTQRHYWFGKDPVLFTICASGEIEHLLQRFEQQAGIRQSPR
jgi:hypothetical protein